MLPLRSRSLTRRMQALAVAVLVVLLAVFTWMVPPHLEVLHNILHHLNILPFMLAGLLFGWRGALYALVFATVLQAPSIGRHWTVMPLDAQDQIVELSIFGAAGVIAGVLADRERMLRQHVEQTGVELERVNRELGESVEHIRKTERLTAAGRLSASLAHEIRNPLASISGAAGILARGVAPATSRAECLEILTAESQRLNKLLTGFLDFAKPRVLRVQRENANALLRSAAALVRHAVPDRAVEVLPFAATTHGELSVMCDAEQIRQVLLNLLLNALQATGNEGHVTLQGRVQAEQVVIEVQDDGAGIAADDVDQVFDPFFTTRPSGTGLGLAVAANIVAQHGGELRCQSGGHGCGSVFRLTLPGAAPVQGPLVAAAGRDA